MAGHQFEAWCSQHQCPPDDCFEQHNPAAANSSDPARREAMYEKLRNSTRLDLLKEKDD